MGGGARGRGLVPVLRGRGRGGGGEGMVGGGEGGNTPITHIYNTCTWSISYMYMQINRLTAVEVFSRHNKTITCPLSLLYKQHIGACPIALESAVFNE